MISRSCIVRNFNFRLRQLTVELSDLILHRDNRNLELLLLTLLLLQLFHCLPYLRLTFRLPDLVFLKFILSLRVVVFYELERLRKFRNFLVTFLHTLIHIDELLLEAG